MGGIQIAGLQAGKRAWAQIKDDIDETGVDRQELLSSSIQTLMAAAGQRDWIHEGRSGINS